MHKVVAATLEAIMILRFPESINWNYIHVSVCSLLKSQISSSHLSWHIRTPPNHNSDAVLQIFFSRGAVLFCFVFCGVCFGVASLLGPIWEFFARLRNVITRFKQAKTQHSRSPWSSRFYNTSSHKIIGSPYSRKYKSALFFNNTYVLRGLLDERRFLKLNHMCA